MRVCENGVAITSKVVTTAETGVEMEALAAVSVSALTLYDMLKAADKGIEIREIVLERKSGGKSGDYRRTKIAARTFMADNVKLLLVDDNPMVLAMLQQALSSLAQVTTATDAADALLKAVDDAPDLAGVRLPHARDGWPAACRETEEPSRDCEFFSAC